jgi:hypothetical protein
MHTLSNLAGSAAAVAVTTGAVLADASASASSTGTAAGLPQELPEFLQSALGGVGALLLRGQSLGASANLSTAPVCYYCRTPARPRTFVVSLRWL